MRAGLQWVQPPLMRLLTVSPTCTRPWLQGCGVQAEADVTLVYSADGTSLGEAFVHFTGPQARLRLGLSRDATVMPVRRGNSGGFCRT